MNRKIGYGRFVGMVLVFGFAGTLFGVDVPQPRQPDTSVQGLYRAILMHEGTGFYQHGSITLRTVNTGSGQLKISANVRLVFGEVNSNEFFTYEFDDCPMNLLTRQISIKDAKNNISIIGFLKSGRIEGEWFSTILGKVGKFVAVKDTEPDVPKNGILVKSLTGLYRGSLLNTNPDANLPERAILTLVTTQDTSAADPKIVISGNLRLYLGNFGSIEYVETKLTDVQFNFYNRYFTARTVDPGLTLKGTISVDGGFTGTVYADGFGEVAKADLRQIF